MFVYVGMMNQESLDRVCMLCRLTQGLMLTDTAWALGSVPQLRDIMDMVYHLIHRSGWGLSL